MISIHEFDTAPGYAKYNVDIFCDRLVITNWSGASRLAQTQNRDQTAINSHTAIIAFSSTLDLPKCPIRHCGDLVQYLSFDAFLCALMEVRIDSLGVLIM